MRFPNLKSFQLRNAVVPDTVLPPDLYLLDYSKSYDKDLSVEWYDDDDDGNDPYGEHGTISYLDLAGLEFMEAHPHLQCLAWPIDRFFSGQQMPSVVVRRVEDVVENLGRTLIDLRVDAMYNGIGEAQSESQNCAEPTTRERRRLFISDVAAKMSKLESIKIEGGVPRDERREIIRALHKCPLEKIVMIGVCCPTGNYWGVSARDLHETLHTSELDLLEGEHNDAIHSLGPSKPDLPGADMRFQPAYGWPPSPPMIWDDCFSTSKGP